MNLIFFFRLAHLSLSLSLKVIEWDIRLLLLEVVEMQLFLLARLLLPKTQATVPLKRDTKLDEDGFQSVRAKEVCRPRRGRA